MEQTTLEFKPFEPEMYCLRCQNMEWDEQKRCCANFDKSACPLSIRDLLADLKVSCLVV